MNSINDLTAIMISGIDHLSSKVFSLTVVEVTYPGWNRGVDILSTKFVQIVRERSGADHQHPFITQAA